MERAMSWNISKTSIDIGGGGDAPTAPGRMWPEDEDLTGKLGRQRHQSASLLRPRRAGEGGAADINEAG